MRAILVEDDEQAALATKKMLARIGFTVADHDDLRSGTEVLVQLAKEPPPDLMIIDICLPGGIDGIEVLHAIRHAGLPGVAPAVVVVSGFGEPTAGAREAIESFAAVFVTKPFSTEELAEAVVMATAASNPASVEGAAPTALRHAI